VFADVGKNDPALLDIAVICIYDSETDSYTAYLEEELGKLWPMVGDQHGDDLIISQRTFHGPFSE